MATLEAKKTPHGTLLLVSSGYHGHSGEVSVWRAADWQRLWRTGMVMDAALDRTGERVVLAWGSAVAARSAASGDLLDQRMFEQGVDKPRLRSRSPGCPARCPR